ncbi:MAG: RHS repeat-associated core domain-containing protein [Flavobacteriales bacterium]
MNHQAAHNQPTNIAALRRGVHRYGFNGKEKDIEGLGGGSNTYDYGFRIYNSNLGKFLSTDPLQVSYPWYTPYQFSGNAPIWAIDVDGLEQAIVVRWYKNNQCTGQTIFVIRNPSDRPLGQNNFLFMNLPDTDANRTSIANLGFATSATPNNIVSNALRTFLANNTEGSNQSDLTDFQGNPVCIQASTGGLVLGNAFVRGSLCQANQRVVDGINSELDESRSLKLVSNTDLNSDIIYFDDESSTFNPSLDTGNDGTPNSQELNQALEKLRLDPDKTARVTGNSSIEDDPGGMSNSGISTARANTVFNLINRNAQQAGINLVGRFTNMGGVGSANANPSPSQNQDSQPSINRNATVSYDIPRQNQ